MTSVFHDWMLELPMQQQTVLVAAIRGPDGVGKFHACKPLVRAYRACIVKQAYTGIAHVLGGPATDTFASLEDVEEATRWRNITIAYINTVDEIPHHYHLHLMHGAQILGYRHPDNLINGRWRNFYFMCCDDMHVNYETKPAMNLRLNDGGRHL